MQDSPKLKDQEVTDPEIWDSKQAIFKEVVEVDQIRNQI